MDLRKPQPVKQFGKKHTDCPFYGYCLDQAVGECWDCWSCGSCRNYLLSAVEERLQYIGHDYGYVLKIYPELKEKYERSLQAVRWQVDEISPAECHIRCRAVVKVS
jgi:hypothetical protein